MKQTLDIEMPAGRVAGEYDDKFQGVVDAFVQKTLSERDA